MTITTTLSELEQTLTHRPIPVHWAIRLRPGPADITVGDLLGAIRDHQRVVASDETIRTLLALPNATEPDPRTIVLLALTPRALRWRHRQTTDLDDVVSELTKVIWEPGPIESQDRLPPPHQPNEQARRSAPRPRSRRPIRHPAARRLHATP